MKKITFLLTLMLLTLGIGSVWGAEYELIATLDCAKASSEGTSALYGSSTNSMSTDKVKAYINAAAGKTLISSNPTISGSLYWSKGSGGGEIPNNVFKLGKASGPGSVKFTIDGTDNVVKVVIVGHGWKTSSSISVNSADAQEPSAQYTEQTFVFDNLSPTKDITISVTSSAVCITSIQLYKEASGGGDEPVIIKTLNSIEVTGMTTNFEIGETFTFDGTCTARYSVIKDDVAQADETAEVTPTSVSEPDMSTAGTKEVTVTYTEGEITKTFTYNITVENALPKIVITQNEVADFTNTYAEYTWTASGVSGKIYGYKNSGMQLNSSKAGSYVYNTDPIPGYIRKIKIVKAASGTTRNWTPYVSETALTSAEGTVLTQETVATTTTWEVTGENSYFYLLESGGATVIESITIYYEAVAPQVTAPTFNPAAGTYNAVQNVTISAEDGTTIYYTCDGENPTTESIKYTTAISVGETMTIKAIAVKDEKVSPVATATYTINLPLTTMDQIFAKATEVKSTATPVEITFNNWVVTGVKSSNAYVTDGTKGLIVYNASHGFNVGDVLSGTASCKVQLYKGSAELTELTSTATGLTVTTSGVVTPVELNEAGIAALTGANTGSVIKVNGTCQNGNKVAGLTLFNSLYSFTDLEVGAEYNVTGVYLLFDSTKEILPRSAADIEKVEGLPTATIDIADFTMEVGQEKTFEATITPNAAISTVQYAITSGSEYITLNGTTITAKAAGTATITATIAEAAGVYYGTTKTFTVTVKPQNIAELPFEFTGGKADIENTLGMSQESLGSDYTTAGVTTKLKFDGTGDCVIIHFNSQAEKLAYEIKGNGFNGGKFTVQQSADGNAYTDVITYTELGDAATKEHELAAESRYVKFIYTNKVNGNVGLGNITISKPDTREEAGLAWDPETVTLTVGDAFTAPTLVNPNSVNGITYESSNEDVATVSAAGVIDLVDDAVGTATITASFPGDATYKPATVTCTIQVKPVQEDCEGSDDFDADQSGNNASSYANRNTTNGWTAVHTAVTTVEEEKFFTINGKTSAVGTITSPVLTGGIGSIKIRYANMNNETNGVHFRLDIKQDDVVVKTFEVDNDEVTKERVYTETIENINVEGDFQMVFTNLSPTNVDSNKDRVSIGRLCWTGYTAPPQIPDYTRTVTPGYYGTICLPYGSSNMTGATFYETSHYEDGKVYFNEVTTLVAGRAYIFLARANKIAIYKKGDETVGAPVVENGLHGTFDYIADVAAVSAAEEYIIVYNNATAQCELSKCITNCWLDPNRAYVVISEIGTTPKQPMPGCSRVGMAVEGENGETGFENITAPEGQSVKAIVNGQLIIIRDGEMYNAMGVKL